MWNIPLLRAGRPYESMSSIRIDDFRSGKPVATVSQANPGLIAKDIRRTNRDIFRNFSTSDMLEICRKATRHFLHSDLPVGGTAQSPTDYVQCLSATTGMPETLCRKNMTKIQGMLENMEQVLRGLTRGLDLSVFDVAGGRASVPANPISFACETNVLGAILPNNSPGVHSLWLPAIAMKVPLILRPGREEPWTPLRIVQSFLAAGCPKDGFGFYPSDYSGATEILLRCGRSMLFGDESTGRPWNHDRRIQIHGPGWSKIIFGMDKISQWQDYLDLMEDSVVENGGRSCINASGIWVTQHGFEIAEALAKRLARIEARSMEDPQARLAAFPMKKVAKRINDMIDSQLRTKGAVDLTARYRKTGRLIEIEGGAYLLPTVIWCEDPSHPLANTEFLFPFVSVVQAPQTELLPRIGHTLVATVITEDETLQRELLSTNLVERLNLGAIPTNRIAWDQPHEGNLFEHLFRQRAFQQYAV